MSWLNTLHKFHSGNLFHYFWVCEILKSTSDCYLYIDDAWAGLQSRCEVQSVVHNKCGTFTAILWFARFFFMVSAFNGTPCPYALSFLGHLLKKRMGTNILPCVTFTRQCYHKIKNWPSNIFFRLGKKISKRFPG